MVSLQPCILQIIPFQTHPGRSHCFTHIYVRHAFNTVDIAKHTFWVCSASSRVGESTNACVSEEEVSSICRMPMENTAVLPVPDCFQENTLRQIFDRAKDDKERHESSRITKDYSAHNKKKLNS